MQAQLAAEYSYFSVTSLSGNGIIAWTRVKESSEWPYLLSDRKTFSFPDSSWSITPNGAITFITMYFEVTGTTSAELTEPIESYLEVVIPTNVGDLNTLMPGGDYAAGFTFGQSGGGNGAVSSQITLTGYMVGDLLGIGAAGDSQISYNISDGGFELGDGSTYLTFDAKLELYTLAA